MPPKEAIEIVASPVPQMALTRRSNTIRTTTRAFQPRSAPTTGPVRGSGFSLCLRRFGRLQAPALRLAGGGGGGSLRYFNAKSETMSCFSETFAFNWNDASCGIAKTTSPVIFVNPYEPDLASGPTHRNRSVDRLCRNFRITHAIQLNIATHSPDFKRIFIRRRTDIHHLEHTASRAQIHAPTRIFQENTAADTSRLNEFRGAFDRDVAVLRTSISCRRLPRS